MDYNYILFIIMYTMANQNDYLSGSHKINEIVSLYIKL